MENNSQIIIYITEKGETKLEVRLENETVWLTQKLMAELFQTTIPNINMHLKNIFDEGELDPNSTIKDFLIVRIEGNREVNRNIEYYNLDAIISVGYRIKSHVATRFRQWATKHIKEFIVKGFVLDDERLKNPDLPYDYFEELLKRIQDIRTSERRFYQNITERADSKKPNMGLTNWRGAKPRKMDVSIAKNYLNEPELSALNNLVEQYLIFATGQAMRRIPMYMKDWIEKLHGFLKLNDRNILTNAGKISHQLAIEKAEKEYEKYNLKINNTIESDFDKAIKKLEAPKYKKKKGE